MIEAQAFVDARNIDTGRVPLHEAASSGNLEVVKLLLEQGVPSLPRTVRFETPAQLARRAGHPETAEFLGILLCFVRGRKKIELFFENII